MLKYCTFFSDSSFLVLTLITLHFFKSNTSYETFKYQKHNDNESKKLKLLPFWSSKANLWSFHFCLNVNWTSNVWKYWSTLSVYINDLIHYNMLIFTWSKMLIFWNFLKYIFTVTIVESETVNKYITWQINKQFNNIII